MIIIAEIGWNHCGDIKLAKQIFETENSIEALVSLCGEWEGDRS